MKKGIVILLCAVIAGALPAIPALIWAHSQQVQGKSFEFRTRDGIEIQVMLLGNNELTVTYNGHPLGSRPNFCEPAQQ